MGRSVDHQDGVSVGRGARGASRFRISHPIVVSSRFKHQKHLCLIPRVSQCLPSIKQAIRSLWPLLFCILFCLGH